MPMKKYIILTLVAILFLPSIVKAQSISSRLAGRILLQVENNGEAWYVNPENYRRYYLARPEDAFNIMKKLGLGISNADFEAVKNNIPERLLGKIIIKTEDFGKAYYINPADSLLYFLGSPKDAFIVMRSQGLGITNNDIRRIPAFNENNNFQNLGWWGQINKDNVSVMEEPASNAKILGKFSTLNRVKILETVSGESVGGTDNWHKIDGGAFPGAYIISSDIDSMEQPEAPINFTIPTGVVEGEYWIDTNLSSKTVTVFLYDEPVFVTYAAIGRPTNPTITGTYRIWTKLEKTRMQGGPPTVPYVYDLRNVPYTMYYYKSYGLHGTYWHDKFGTQQSAGCTNLTQGDAEYIFNIVSPILLDGIKTVYSDKNNPGTVVHNHY